MNPSTNKDRWIVSKLNKVKTTYVHFVFVEIVEGEAYTNMHVLSTCCVLYSVPVRTRTCNPGPIIYIVCIVFNVQVWVN